MARIAKIDTGAVKGNVDQHKSAGSFHKFAEGANYVRFMPPIVGKVTPGTYYGLHHKHDWRSDQSYASFRCLTDLGQWCPLCTARKLFASSPQETLQKAAEALYPKPAYFFSAVTGKLITTKEGKRRIIPQEEPGVVILQLSNALVEKLEALRTGDWGDFTDPEKGYWVNIHRTGTGKATRYKQVTPSKALPRKLPEWVDLDDLPNLTSSRLSGMKKATELRLMLVDRYGDECDEMEDVMQEEQRKWRAKNKKTKDATEGDADAEE